MRPQWRGQPFGNFRIVFNAALFSAEVAGAHPGSSAFWVPPEEESKDETGSEGRRR
jgi:hypothetical protein